MPRTRSPATRLFSLGLNDSVDDSQCLRKPSSLAGRGVRLRLLLALCSEIRLLSFRRRDRAEKRLGLLAELRLGAVANHRLERGARFFELPLAKTNLREDVKKVLTRGRERQGATEQRDRFVTARRTRD